MQWYQRRVHGDRSLNSQRIFFLSLLKNCNHKRLGIYYLLSAFIFGISGTLVSVLMRIELYSSGNRIISPENQNFYNKHNLAWASYDLLFSNARLVWRIRELFCCYLSYLLLILSLISEFGGGTGWTLYPPLSTSFM